MKKRYYILLMIILCGIDQLSKALIHKFLGFNEGFNIINNFLKFYYVKNTGISFGMLSNMKILIVPLSLCIIGFMLYQFYKEESKLNVLACSLIISGAFGNLIDRLTRGYVIDFISFTFFKHEVSIFNVADSFITIGVILYIIGIFLEGRNEDNSEE